jgi:hypothetical protein
MQVITIGIDLAKNVFQVHGVDANDKLSSTSRCGDHNCSPSSPNSRRVASAWKLVRRPTTGRASSRSSATMSD